MNICKQFNICANVIPYSHNLLPFEQEKQQDNERGAEMYFN